MTQPETAPESRIWQASRDLLSIVGPVTIITALLYYFGRASAHTSSVMICCRFLLFRRSSRIPLLPFEQYRANYSTFFPIRQVCRLFRISLRILRIWCIIVQNRRSISGFPRKTGFFLRLTVTTFRTS